MDEMHRPTRAEDPIKEHNQIDAQERGLEEIPPQTERNGLLDTIHQIAQTDPDRAQKMLEEVRLFASKNGREGRVSEPGGKRTRRKQPKTKLHELTRSGLLQEGQPVFLHDYQGNRVSGYQASIAGKALEFKGQITSMSELAREFLTREGYNSGSVRGPAHWFTEDGVSIATLWKEYLNSERRE